MLAHELCETKAVNVRLLCEKGDGLPGNVLTLSGHEAAALVRIGHAEVTTGKPSRVLEQVQAARDAGASCVELAALLGAMEAAPP